ncbi:hypothetical protein, partial [Sansalvadorimonas verongulae]|uniref:hypothetical protein n=1 Tax=Sansalvadorimonas verongulae TaxID=2172824 RepID=UPI0012BC81B0
MKLTKSFKYSINGFEVETFEAGEHEELHPDVVAYAEKIGALAGAEEPQHPVKPEPEPEPEP